MFSEPETCSGIDAEKERLQLSGAVNADVREKRSAARRAAEVADKNSVCSRWVAEADESASGCGGHGELSEDRLDSPPEFPVTSAVESETMDLTSSRMRNRHWEMGEKRH